MAKNDIEKEVVEKKRRKVSSHEIAPKVGKEDVYNNVINYEEQETAKRTATKDAQIFNQTCDDLRRLFDEIGALKEKSDEKYKQEIAEKRIEGSLQFVVLKKINRLDKVRIRSGREALHKEKLRVDSNRLQLQNLLYEANHLNREVNRCYQFKSSDEEIELVSEAEFFAKAPESISRPEKTKEDKHARHLAQLEWELQQRKLLDVQCKDLMTSIENVKVDIVSKNERLDSLGPRLQDLLKATRPLQDALDMNIEKNWEIQSLKNLLPNPLYLLYSNVSAYAEACDSLLTAMIEGDEDEAKLLADEQKHADASKDIEEPDSENEDAEPDVDNEKSRHHRKQSKSSILDQKRDKLFKNHPLSVTFTIKTKERKGSLTVTLNYLMNLGLITVHARLNDFDDIGVSAGDVVSTENILDALNPNDLGLESPNSRTKYQLQDLKINPDQLIPLLNERKLGKPYKWAQTLCGFDVTVARPTAGNVATVSAELCQNSVPEIVKLIRTRWSARLDLYHQIHALESGNVDTGDNSAPIRLSSTLLQWTSISFEEYVAANSTKLFVEDNYTASNDLYYRAIVTRGSAKLECYICISCNYPVSSPLWSLSLNWNGKHTAANDATLREMEFWVNSIEDTPKSARKNLLIKQLQRTMSCLDIYLETESIFYSPVEFTADKTFIRAFRGRQRARPFKTIPNGSGVVYTQL